MGRWDCDLNWGDFDFIYSVEDWEQAASDGLRILSRSLPVYFRDKDEDLFEGMKDYIFAHSIRCGHQ